jgi:peptidoglycan/LPS O-acetylase OafA/YrhL
MRGARRSARVDLLRGASIFAVLLLHFSLSYDLSGSPLSRVVSKKLVAAAVYNGNYGVTIFFVISGFLITSNNLLRYQRLGDVNLRQFYEFRFSRIIPPLLLALAIIVTFGLLGVPSFRNSVGGQPLPASFFWIATISVLTFWHNVLMESVGWFNYCMNIYWSLSVEEVFYLAFPLACVLLRRGWLVVGLCAVFIMAGPAYRSAHADNELYFECGYLGCFDAIAIGCLTAMLYESLQVRRIIGRPARILAAIALIITYFRGIDGHEVWGFTLIAACAAVLLSNAFEGSLEGSKRLPARAVCWLGRHSYELYLFHIIILAGFRTVVPAGTMSSGYKWPCFLLFVAMSALLAGAVARFYAEPLNAALRTRLRGVARQSAP